MGDRYQLKKAMIFPAFVNLVFIFACPFLLWKFWSNFTPEQWTAIGTVCLAITTALLYFSAMWQLFLIKKEAKKNRTLDICNRYDNDPTFDSATELLATAKQTGDLKANPVRYKKAIVTILNYLDSVAIGIEQGLYINDLAKDHLNEILQSHVSEYLLDTQLARDCTYDVRHFKRLKLLSEKWNEAPTNYRE
jgi:Domain of unknown function (DUF4760)